MSLFSFNVFTHRFHRQVFLCWWINKVALSTGRRGEVRKYLTFLSFFPPPFAMTFSRELYAKARGHLKYGPRSSLHLDNYTSTNHCAVPGFFICTSFTPGWAVPGDGPWQSCTCRIFRLQPGCNFLSTFTSAQPVLPHLRCT